MADSGHSDHYRGYRHPFLFGIHYLGGVGGKLPTSFLTRNTNDDSQIPLEL